MRKLGKLVAGASYTDEKGKMTIPPRETSEMSIKESIKNGDWIVIPLQQRTHKKETER